ncbi:MAG TPA: hypothetical protein VNS32_11875, partial [Flavisolibacter sp.]|nr:hypothetical protein [Flavisolibacter sp.]
AVFKPLSVLHAYTCEKANEMTSVYNSFILLLKSFNDLKGTPLISARSEEQLIRTRSFFVAYEASINF